MSEIKLEDFRNEFEKKDTSFIKYDDYISKVGKLVEENKRLKNQVDDLTGQIIEGADKHLSVCDELSEKTEKLEEFKQSNAFLEDELFDAIWQSCSNGSEIDSMCMSAYIPAIDYFIKKGKLKEISRNGRRIIAEYVPEKERSK